VGLYLINRLRDSPQSLGLPSIEKYRDDYPTKKHSDKETERLPAREILFKYVLRNKYIWVLSAAYFFVYIVRTAVNDWTSLFLVETKGYSISGATAAVFWFEAGGFLGSLAAGWSSDKLFHGKRGPINAIFSFLVLIAVVVMWKVPETGIIFDSAVIFAIGFFIFGPQMLIGMACAELSDKNAAGTATGFAGWFAYIGAAVAGGPLGAIAKNWGWDGYFIALIISCAIAVLFLLPLWAVKVNKDLVES